MNKFITKAQTLGRKAAQLGQAVQSLPGHAAKIREAVTMTGAELHQLRADVEGSIDALKADNEERLLVMMREINDHALTFEEAGYELTGLDLDLALHQRLVVHLDKFEDVPHATLRALQAKQTSDSIRSIMSGIVKAEETAANVELTHLSYTGLHIHAGAIPTIRMMWRIPEDEVIVESVPTVASAAQPAVPVSSSALGSIFEPRPMPSQAVRVVPQATEPQPAAVAREQTQAPEAASAWSQSALDRFKKMPGASKYGR
jgi:hypothetical protein